MDNRTLVERFLEDIIFNDCQVEYEKPHKPLDHDHPLEHHPDYTKDFVLYYKRKNPRT